MFIRIAPLCACTILSLAAAGSARAAVIVAPNAYASMSGSTGQSGIFGNSFPQGEFQEEIAASQLGGLPVGAVVSGLGYRLASGSTTIGTTLTYSGFTIQLGAAAYPVGSLTTDLGANYSGSPTTVRTGALTVAPGSLVGGSGLNPFYTLAFATPYTYTGGDLLITTTYLYSSSAAPDIQVDAVPVGGVTGTAAPVLTGGAVKTGFFNAPVVQLTYNAPATAVPEPGTLPLIAAGAGLLGLARLRRARKGKAFS